jgi:hypothetical protein
MEIAISPQQTCKEAQPAHNTNGLALGSPLKISHICSTTSKNHIIMEIMPIYHTAINFY